MKITNDIVPLVYWERNGYHDSDFYLTFLDLADGEVKVELVDTTRAAGGYISPTTGKELPLTTETLESVRVWLKKRALTSLQQQDMAQSQSPKKGRACFVVSGRKIKPGQTVLCVGNPVNRGKYCYGAEEVTDILVRTESNSLVHVNVRHLSVVDSAQYLTPSEQLESKAEAISYKYEVPIGTWATKDYVYAFLHKP